MVTVLAIMARGTLATIFIFAGAAKLIEPKPAGLFMSNLWPRLTSWMTPVVIALSILEIGIGLAVLLAPFLGASAASLLLGSFIMALLFARWKGVHAPCGCFGSVSERNSNHTLIRNLLWTIAALLSAFAHTRFFQTSEQVWQSVLLLSSFVISLGGVLLLTAKTIENNDISLSRRRFLKFAGVSVLALAFSRIVGAAGCCGCQYYDHWDPPCCGNPPSFHTHHYYKRCCNLCNGAKGSWHSYKTSACKDCECVEPPCDILHPCTTEVCYSSECC